MKSAYRVLALLIIAAMFTSSLACTTTSSSSPTATVASANTGSTPQAAKNEPAGTVNIGVLGPLTGGSALVGNDQAEGAELAASKINDAGGLKVGGKSYKVNVIRYDDQGKPEVAVNLGRRMRSVDNVAAMVGPAMSSPTLALLEINEKEDFMMVTMAMNPGITEKGNKLIIRTNITTAMVAGKMAEVLVKQEGKKAIGLIADSGDWGKSYADVMLKKVPELGGTIVASEAIDEVKQTDFYTQLTNVINKKPEVISLVAHDAAAAMVVKQARELGYTGLFAFTEGFQSEGRRLATWEKMGVGSYLVANAVDLKLPGALKYMDDFKAKYNKEGMAYGLLSYAEAMLIFRAMEKAGSVSDTAKIRAAVPEIYKGINNESGAEFLAYDPSGQIEISQPVVKHTGNGNLELLMK